ncbi:MAG: efflux RND transporter periplasmic adaptor subunit [Planctomycetota bacterium]|nr:MAG: efflux RND transporter periplasmic adaptor subunit [Planctomycetota bacterium]
MKSHSQHPSSHKSMFYGIGLTMATSIGMVAIVMLAGWRPNVASTNSRGASPRSPLLTAVSQVSDRTPPPPADASTEIVIELDAQQVESAGIKTEVCRRQPFSQTIEVTGKVALNEDRLAHIHSMVDGLVDRVAAGLGDHVQADQLLAVIHSREVGAAKLELYQARLELEMARVRFQLAETIASNTLQLVQALKDGVAIEAIEEAFRNKHMGDYRARLLGSYAEYLKSAADLQRLQEIRTVGAVAEKTILSARTKRNADLAVFQATLEEVEHELKSQKLELSQAVQKAESRVTVALSNLSILGVEPEAVDSIDPAELGESISDYPVRAPFDGTIIMKDIVLREQVTSNKLLFSVADLSEVWVSADIYEEHIPLLHQLDGRQITLRTAAWPGKTFTATVFYAGDLVDEATRTVSMRAVASNPEGLLKPGMYVSVELPSVDSRAAVVVPVSALQHHAGKDFVFVQVADGKFQRQDVQVAGVNETEVAIARGLQEGQRVVVQGGFILKTKMLEDLLEE